MVFNEDRKEARGLGGGGALAEAEHLVPWRRQLGLLGICAACPVVPQIPHLGVPPPPHKKKRLQINGLLLVHLPNGPTARFRLSNVVRPGARRGRAGQPAGAGRRGPAVECAPRPKARTTTLNRLRRHPVPPPPGSQVLGQDIKGHGRPTSHRPELVLNNFETRLGHRLGRMFASLFHQAGRGHAHEGGELRRVAAARRPSARPLARPPARPPLQDPHFRGRRVVTFHNQRDFIFFRWGTARGG